MTNPTERMTLAYIEAIYFTETGDDDQPSSTASLTPLSRARAFIDCRNFLEAARRNGIDTGAATAEQIGHDLWLTRNGHGAGFWDRKGMYPQESVKALCAMAQAMGETDAEFEPEEEPADDNSRSYGPHQSRDSETR